MRIISGKYKGRRIAPPKNLPVRPTTDMSKEALFNVLNNHFNFSELKVLELFAGTGSISYEFGSRGCSPILCVDGDMGCVNFIKKTAKEFEFDITAIKSDVFTFLEKHSGNYDIIFADPPYDLNWLSDIPDMVINSELMNSDSIFIMEHPKSISFGSHPLFSEHRHYGSVNFTFFKAD